MAHSTTWTAKRISSSRLSRSLASFEVVMPDGVLNHLSTSGSIFIAATVSIASTAPTTSQELHQIRDWTCRRNGVTTSRRIDEWTHRRIDLAADRLCSRGYYITVQVTSIGTTIYTTYEHLRKISSALFREALYINIRPRDYATGMTSYGTLRSPLRIPAEPDPACNPTPTPAIELSICSSPGQGTFR